MAVVKAANGATEQSTYVVQVSFADEQGDAVTPKSITWTLTDMENHVINGRQDVAITPAVTIEIVLHGDDLMISDDYGTKRELLVAAIYDSDLGNDLELKQALQFNVHNLVAV